MCIMGRWKLPVLLIVRNKLSGFTFFFKVKIKSIHIVHALQLKKKSQECALKGIILCQDLNVVNYCLVVWSPVVCWHLIYRCLTQTPE